MCQARIPFPGYLAPQRLLVTGPPSTIISFPDIYPPATPGSRNGQLIQAGG